jgi:hypothetical protein
MDASQYKDYVLVLLFVKYVSDKYAGQKDALLDVPVGGRFADMVALKGDKEIGDKMTAHVECTVNQLINWRMCKKQQMGWSRAGAQYLLHVKTAIINGRLERCIWNHSIRPISPPDPPGSDIRFPLN